GTPRRTRLQQSQWRRTPTPGGRAAPAWLVDGGAGAGHTRPRCRREAARWSGTLMKPLTSTVISNDAQLGNVAKTPAADADLDPVAPDETYTSPTGDEPLDALIASRVRQELEEEQRQHVADQRPSRRPDRQAPRFRLMRREADAR